MNEKRTQVIARRFSSASRSYHRASVIQRDVALRLMLMIRPYIQVPRILEVGCGTGLLTELLVKSQPETRVNATDVSELMIAMAQQRLAQLPPRVQWSVGDIMAWPELDAYPLVVASSAIHWLYPFHQGILKLSRLLQNGGKLVVSVMLQGTLQDLRDIRLRVAPHKAPPARLPTADEVRSAFAGAGLSMIEAHLETHVLEVGSAFELLRFLHNQGVTGATLFSSTVPMNRRELKQVMDIYEAECKSARGVFAKYQVGYFAAEKTE